jgi:hypothetical protein
VVSILYNRIISLRGEMWAHETSLIKNVYIQFLLKRQFQSREVNSHLFVCKGCGEVNSHSYVCKGCGEVNSHLYVCKGCGEVNSHLYVCKGCRF